MHISPFQAMFPRLEYVTSPDSFFTTVKEEYPKYRRGGFFRTSEAASIYLYRINTPQRQYTGILATADIRDYLDGHIKRHEQTIASKEQRQLQLLLKRQAMVKPILLTYPDVEALKEVARLLVLQKPPVMTVQFPGDQQVHEVWEFHDPMVVRELTHLFATRVPVAFIADGHHRCSVLARLYEKSPKGQDPEASPYRFLPCAFFPASELDISPFHRVIEVLQTHSPTRLMVQLADLFDIEILESPRLPERKHQMLMHVRQEYYMLYWKKYVLERHRNDPAILDTFLLDKYILGEIFGIQDVRNDERIEYVEGPQGLEGLERKTQKNDHRVGFCLYPVNLDEVFQLARCGEVLPPKSTWFEPRMRNGIVVHEYSGPYVRKETP